MKEYHLTVLTAAKIFFLAFLMLAEPLELLFFVVCVLLVAVYWSYWYFSDKKSREDGIEDKEEIFWDRVADIVFGGGMLIIFIPIIGDAIWFWAFAGVITAANTAVLFAYSIKEKEKAGKSRMIRRTAKTLLICFPLIYAAGGVITASALCGGAAVFLLIEKMIKGSFNGRSRSQIKT